MQVTVGVRRSLGKTVDLLAQIGQVSVQFIQPVLALSTERVAVGLEYVLNQIRLGMDGFERCVGRVGKGVGMKLELFHGRLQLPGGPVYLCAGRLCVV